MFLFTWTVFGDSYEFAPYVSIDKDLFPKLWCFLFIYCPPQWTLACGELLVFTLITRWYHIKITYTASAGTNQVIGAIAKAT